MPIEKPNDGNLNDNIKLKRRKSSTASTSNPRNDTNTTSGVQTRSSKRTDIKSCARISFQTKPRFYDVTYNDPLWTFNFCEQCTRDVGDMLRSLKRTHGLSLSDNNPVTWFCSSCSERVVFRDYDVIQYLTG